jgi:hypothetical protein
VPSPRRPPSRPSDVTESYAEQVKLLDAFTAYDAAALAKVEQDRQNLIHAEYVRSVLLIIRDKATLGHKECQIIVEPFHAQATLTELTKRRFKVDREGGSSGWIISWDLPVIPQPAGGR